MTYDMHILRTGCAELGVTLSQQQEQQFIKFYEYLIEKNKVMNLTGITDFEEVLIKHFLDSISCVKVLNMDEIESIIDVGTGAGFPGIPLKILFPHINMCLLDSLKKRVAFLDEVINLLGLQSISAVHGRAEEYAKNKKYREKYDLCVSRAVSNLATLSEYCLPFTKCGGYFISYKSGKIQEEVENSRQAIKILGGEVKNIEYFNIPQSDIERSFVIIKKRNVTPGKYPRKAGTPLKEPLK